ncbi:thiol peroxidase [Acholeplasma vituli]|uniref:Thiol peroxidase n=1 Tax=Paracholeplasma vituli TaxID=69473 RepID=A0ABT2PV14_9MOLU|nr:thiol peroxidase [Paracholeplasma vituli]MCU0104772.1 thiol peroxidase [Paracholeplasma vituli]
MKTFKQKPITVLGQPLKVGDLAPEFNVVDNNLEAKHLSDFKTETIVLNVVPSLDTGVCSLQTRKINEQLASYKDITVLTISNDLPFAQRRWCGAEGLDNIITLSDYQQLDFAWKYGVHIEELRLLARSVFVLNENREVVYVEYLDEMSQHPNYDQLFAFLNGFLNQ